MYRVEIIFRFNQDNTLPDCLRNVHRLANTDYYEIYAGEFSQADFDEVYTYLCETDRGGGFVTYYFEFLKK